MAIGLPPLNGERMRRVQPGLNEGPEVRVCMATRAHIWRAWAPVVSMETVTEDRQPETWHSSLSSPVAAMRLQRL